MKRFLCLFTAIFIYITPIYAYNEVISPQYDFAGFFSENDIAVVEKDGKWGYINLENKQVIPFDYDIAYSFNENLAVVGKLNDKGTLDLGFINQDNDYKPFVYLGENYTISIDDYNQSDYIFHNNSIVLNTDNGAMICDKLGNIIYKENIYILGALNQGVIPAINNNGKYILLNNKLEVVKEFASSIANIYSSNQQMLPFVNLVYGEYKLGFMDSSTYATIINAQFTTYVCQNEQTLFELFDHMGMFITSKGGNLGAIDKTGKTVIEFKYKDLYPTSEGLMAFSSNGKYGFMDFNENIIIKEQFDKVTSFNNGVALAKIGSENYIINKQGEKLYNNDKISDSTYFTHEYTHPISEMVIIEKNGKYGYATFETKDITPLEEEMSYWAFEEVKLAFEKDLIPASLQNSYKSDITRMEFAKLVVNLIDEIQGVKDIEISDVFNDTTNTDILYANSVGIINGYGDGTFRPYEKITRQEAAALLTRTAEFLGKDISTNQTTVSDKSSISSWFLDSVSYVNQENIMTTTGNNNFSPQSTYTREQAYMTIYRLYKLF